MPILVVLALAAACAPVEWLAPLTGGGREVAVGFAATAVGLALAVAITLRRWVVRTLRHSPIRKPDIADTYSRVRRVMFFLNIGTVTLAVLVFGWGWFVQTTVVVTQLGDDGKPLLAPFAELLVPLPYFAMLLVAWLVYYDAERALHRTTVLGPIDRPFWSRAGYMFNHARQFALLVMLPVLLFAFQQTILRFDPETTQADWFQIASLACMPLLLIAMPLLIKPVLGLTSMPAGPIRERLEALAARLHFRCSDFLLWPTHGAAANAMIVGLVPRIRYVVFTDRILEDLPADELDAVFGHEVGHAKHGHIWNYAAFLALSMTVLAALLLCIGMELDAAGVTVPMWARTWVKLVPMLFVAGYIFVVFGHLSRRCERQADVYGCRAVSCGDPNCTGHGERTLYPERAVGLCATGIRTFVRALERVGLSHGHTEPAAERRSLSAFVKEIFAWLAAWQHSTMPRRVTFLLNLIGHPERERRFQRSVTLMRWGLMLSLVAALYGLGSAVGWSELWKYM